MGKREKTLGCKNYCSVMIKLMESRQDGVGDVCYTVLGYTVLESGNSGRKLFNTKCVAHNIHIITTIISTTQERGELANVSDLGRGL